jgi:hypothetical protein
MRQKSGPEKQPTEDAIRTFGARPVDTFQVPMSPSIIYPRRRRMRGK